MNLLTLFNKQKAVPFSQFCDAVRQAVRRAQPSAQFKTTDNGFVITINKTPVACNLRSLYAEYSATPQEREAIIGKWLDTLVTEVPDQPWYEAQNYLRPVLKSQDYIAAARHVMQRAAPPDDLPAEPFAGELYVHLVREFGTIVEGVTQQQLDSWGVAFPDALKTAINNIGMRNFPNMQHEMKANGVCVGLAFDDNYLTASWLIHERFRDFLALRLQGDYVVFVPNRSRLIAVRADETSLINTLMASNRSYRSLPYYLTEQCFHVHVGTTGGCVTVYQGLRGAGPIPPAPLAAGNLNLAGAPTSAHRPGAPPMVDLSQWGLAEPTEDASLHVKTPWDR